MFNHPLPSSWLSHQVHLFPNNPYPSPPPPSPIPHKVWILDCHSCGTFITNRGMKAVLLLRPNVSLYSSDALPVNCSVFTSNPEVLRPRTSRRPNSSRTSSRTCECLTQTLCCHGCGVAIGYMIVIPCARCTTSISANNRATNGHRFVFHAGEVVGTERHYIDGEPGVVPFVFTGAPTSAFPTLSTSSHPYAYPPPYVISRDPHSIQHSMDQSLTQPRASSPSLRSEYLPTPPLEFADPAFLSSSPTSLDTPTVYYPSTTIPGFRNLQAHPSLSPSPQRPHSRHSTSRTPPQNAPRHSPRLNPQTPSPDLSAIEFTAGSTPPPSSPALSFGSPQEQQKDQSTPRMLKDGDVLYWHHLARTGEIPAVEDYERARRGSPTVAPGAHAKGACKQMFDR